MGRHQVGHLLLLPDWMTRLLLQQLLLTGCLVPTSRVLLHVVPTGWWSLSLLLLLQGPSPEARGAHVSEEEANLARPTWPAHFNHNSSITTDCRLPLLLLPVLAAAVAWLPLARQARERVGGRPAGAGPAAGCLLPEEGALPGRLRRRQDIPG